MPSNQSILSYLPFDSIYEVTECHVLLGVALNLLQKERAIIPPAAELLLKAVGIGLLLAVPVGPIGLLCLRRSLTSGMAAGLATGLGAATADAIYAAVAAFALAAAAPLLAEAGWLRLAGGVVLIGLGVRDIASRHAPAAVPTLRGTVGAYSGTVLLTLANPATVLTFAAIILGLGLVPDLISNVERGLFVAGVFLGSALWWVVLSAAGAAVGTRLPPATIPWTRRIVGIALAGFGAIAISGVVG